MNKIPIVSIFCATYNHEKFIANAIEGFLMQKTNFDFEIIICEDKSTDNTAKIVRYYEQKFPERIKVFYHKENLYSKKIDFFVTEFLPHARGRYLALCEGDDHWTDSLKLQKQVDFLEENPSYSLCLGGYLAKVAKTNQAHEVIYSGKSNDAGLNGFSFDLEDMKHRWFFSTLTAMLVNSPSLSSFMQQHKYARDVHIFYHVMKLGKGFYFKEVFGVYNIHAGGTFSGVNNIKRLDEHYLLYKELWHVNRDDFSRHVYYRIILNYFNVSLYDRAVTTNLRFSVGLLFSAFPLIKNFKDILFFCYRLLPPLSQITKE